MAAIFQLRRGTTAQKPTLVAGEMYVDQTSENLIIGVDGSKEITLLKLNDINTGSLHLTGDIRLSGSIYLGNETADNISALGVFTTNLVPSGNSTKDVGTPTAYWKNVYATNISGAIAATNGIISGSSQLTDTFELVASSTHTILSGSSQIIGILNSLNSFSSSILNETASLESRAQTLATYTGSIEGRFSTLATLTGSNLVRLSNLETTSASVNDRLTTISSVTSSLETRMATLANVTSSIHSYTSSLKTALSLSGTDVTVLGNLTVNGTTTQINSTTLNIGDNIIELNYGGSQTISGIYTKDATGTSTTSGSLIWDAANGADYWKAGKLGNESKILLAGGDNIISSSMQLTQLNSFTASVTSSLLSIYQTTSSLNLFSASVTSSLNSIYQTTGSLNSWSASAKIQLTNLELKSASVDTSISNINLNTASVNISVSNLNNQTASIENRFTTLSSYTSSVNQTTASLNLYTASANIWSGTIDARFLTLQQVTSSLIAATSSLLISSSLMTASVKKLRDDVDYLYGIGGISGGNPLTPIQEWSASAKIQLANLELTSASVNTFTQSASGRLTNLELKSASVDTSISNINSFTSSINTTIKSKLDSDGVVSGSSQIISILSSLNSFTSSLNATYATDAEVAAGYEAKGRGIFSGSSQIPNTSISNAQLVNSAITIAGTSVSLGSSITAAKILEATNVISSSTQISSLLPSGVVSGSSQIDLTATTNYASGILTRLNVVGVISGSSQINLGSATGNITLATQTIGDYVASLVQGTGVTITNNSGENATPTISIGQAVGTASNVQHSSLGIGTAASGVSGEIRATGDITAYYSSDERLKENITPIQNAVDKINQIGGYNYDWKDGFETIHSHKGHDLGVIAQEVQSILPEIVTERETGYLAVDYVKLVPVLIEAIKELSAKIDRLENK